MYGMTPIVTFLLSLLCWKICSNDLLSHQIIDCLGVLTSLFGADGEGVQTLVRGFFRFLETPTADSVEIYVGKHNLARADEEEGALYRR